MADTCNPEVRSTWQVKTRISISESALSQLQKKERRNFIKIGYTVTTALLARHLIGWQLAVLESGEQCMTSGPVSRSRPEIAGRP